MSEIGRKAILMALGKAMGIVDVKQAPSELDTTSVKVVTGLDPGFMGYEAWQANGIGLAIAGLADVNWVIVGDAAGSVVTAPFKQEQNGGFEYAVMGLRVSVRYNPAGIVTDAGQMPFVSYYRQVTASGNQAPESFIEMGLVDPAVNEDTYIHSFPFYLARRAYQLGESTSELQMVSMSLRPIWVPAGTSFGLYVAKRGGALWPAATELDIYAWGVRTPKGMRPPGIS